MGGSPPPDYGFGGTSGDDLGNPRAVGTDPKDLGCELLAILGPGNHSRLGLDHSSAWATSLVQPIDHQQVEKEGSGQRLQPQRLCGYGGYRCPTRYFRGAGIRDYCEFAEISIGSGQRCYDSPNRGALVQRYRNPRGVL